MKERMIAGLPDSLLQVIDAGAVKSTIEWEENGKEFSLDGKMYDVVKMMVQSGRTYYYCINDEKEEQLLNTYSKLVNAVPDNNSTGKPARNLIKFKITDLNISEPYHGPVFYSLPLPKWIVASESSLSSGIDRIQTPPPRHTAA